VPQALPSYASGRPYQGRACGRGRGPGARQARARFMKDLAKQNVILLE
jgi:hypothetical protein